MNIPESCKEKQNTFDARTLYFIMFVDDEIVVEILNKLDDSMDELVAQQKFKDWMEMEDFLELQYESRLKSILRGKSSSIDDLKSEMKNIIVLRKKRLFNHLKQTYQKREI
jgi:hypothetical protein